MEPGVGGRCPSVSPEPGFPKRRPAALSRITVPSNEQAYGSCENQHQHSNGTIPSCHSDYAPPLSATGRLTRPLVPRMSKPGGLFNTADTGGAGAGGGVGLLHHHTPSKVLVMMLALLLMTALCGLSTVRQRQLRTLADAERKKHQDEMKLQVAWLATAMGEHDQCKAALQKADADFQLTKLNWQQCETERKQQTADATTAAKAAEGAAKQLQQELDSTRTALKEATGKLQHAQQELSTVKQQQQDNKQQADKQQQDTPAQTELETARQSLKAATEKLKGAQGELSAAQQQQYQQHHLLHAQIEVLQQQLREEQGQHSQWMEQQHKLQQEKDQLLKEKQELMQALQKAQGGASAASQLQAAAVPLPVAATITAADGSTSTSTPATHSDTPIVMVTCSAADTSPVDAITPWCEAVVAAGVPRVMVVSDDAACVAAAKAAGIKVLQHAFMVPTISGPLAAVNHLSYRRYAAIQQVLSLGHAAVSVLPEVLLLADPVPLLHQHPTDITVMSTAWADEQMAYGHLHTPEGSSSSSGDAMSALSPTFHISGLSPALVYLKPQPSSLQFVARMLEGLAAGQHSEATLMNHLLLPPWHLHLPNNMDAANTAAASAATATSVSSSSTGVISESQPTASHLLTPVTLGVLPLSLFTSSERVFKESNPQAWLQQQQPVAIHMEAAASPNRQSQVQTVLQWLQADVQEVIAQLEQQQGHTQAPASAPVPAIVPAATAATTTATKVLPPALPPQHARALAGTQRHPSVLKAVVPIHSAGKTGSHSSSGTSGSHQPQLKSHPDVSKPATGQAGQLSPPLQPQRQQESNVLGSSQPVIASAVGGAAAQKAAAATAAAAAAAAAQQHKQGSSGVAAAAAAVPTAAATSEQQQDNKHESQSKGASRSLKGQQSHRKRLEVYSEALLI